MYSMFREEELLQFCFATFDLNSNGQLDEEEFMGLCKASGGG